MSEPEPNPESTPLRIDALVTNWSLVRRAHDSQVTSPAQARNELVLRYSEGIRRYVHAMMKGDSAADEVSQDVIVRMLKGDLGGADADRGRFRDFLKVVVRNMVRNHWAKQNRRRPEHTEVQELSIAEDDDDSKFDDVWRNEILSITWQSLQEEEREKPSGLVFTILQLRAANPSDNSEQLAEKLGKKLGRSVRADALRQKLRRARIRFTELLLKEVANGLQTASADEVEAELMDLGLYERLRGLLPSDWKERFFTA